MNGPSRVITSAGPAWPAGTLGDDSGLRRHPRTHGPPRGFPMHKGLLGGGEGAALEEGPGPAASTRTRTRARACPPAARSAFACLALTSTCICGFCVYLGLGAGRGHRKGVYTVPHLPCTEQQCDPGLKCFGAVFKNTLWEPLGGQGPPVCWGPEGHGFRELWVGPTLGEAWRRVWLQGPWRSPVGCVPVAGGFAGSTSDEQAP